MFDEEGLSRLEELNSDYINEHYGDLQDTAYRKGRESVFHELEISGSQKGESADDAWEAARKIIRMSDGDILDLFPDCYASVCTAVQAILKYDASEAITKLKAYEEKQSDKIEVGDEVEPFYTDITGVVTLIDGDTIYILWRDGLSTSAMKLKEVTKTGRHFDIASILEDMRHD